MGKYKDSTAYGFSCTATAGWRALVELLVAYLNYPLPPADFSQASVRWCGAPVRFSSRVGRSDPRFPHSLPHSWWERVAPAWPTIAMSYCLQPLPNASASSLSVLPKGEHFRKAVSELSRLIELRGSNWASMDVSERSGTANEPRRPSTGKASCLANKACGQLRSELGSAVFGVSATTRRQTEAALRGVVWCCGRNDSLRTRTQAVLSSSGSCQSS